MNGSEWLAKLPNLPGPARDKMVLEAVTSGLLYCGWEEVTSSIPDHTATFFVTDDAFRVDLEDGSRFRPQVSAQLAQQCADIVTGTLPTPKLMDLSYQQADVKLAAAVLPAKPDMVTTAKSVLFNKTVETKRGGRSGLIRDCGKAWVLSNKMAKGPLYAVNHGFYDPKAIYVSNGIKLWQNRGAAHDRSHTDYSQTLILTSSYCLLDGASCPILDIMTHPTLCKLISDEGRLNYTRQKI
jgi:hypothetical protein